MHPTNVPILTLWEPLFNYLDFSCTQQTGFLFIDCALCTDSMAWIFSNIELWLYHCYTLSHLCYFSFHEHFDVPWCLFKLYSNYVQIQILRTFPLNSSFHEPDFLCFVFQVLFCICLFWAGLVWIVLDWTGSGFYWTGLVLCYCWGTSGQFYQLLTFCRNLRDWLDTLPFFTKWLFHEHVFLFQSLNCFLNTNNYLDRD